MKHTIFRYKPTENLWIWHWRLQGHQGNHPNPSDTCHCCANQITLRVKYIFFLDICHWIRSYITGCVVAFLNGALYYQTSISNQRPKYQREVTYKQVFCIASHIWSQTLFTFTARQAIKLSLSLSAYNYSASSLSLFPIRLMDKELPTLRSALRTMEAYVILRGFVPNAAIQWSITFSYPFLTPGCNIITFNIYEQRW